MGENPGACNVITRFLKMEKVEEIKGDVTTDERYREIKILLAVKMEARKYLYSSLHLFLHSSLSTSRKECSLADTLILVQ